MCMCTLCGGVLGKGGELCTMENRELERNDNKKKSERENTIRKGAKRKKRRGEGKEEKSGNKDINKEMSFLLPFFSFGKRRGFGGDDGWMMMSDDDFKKEETPARSDRDERG